MDSTIEARRVGSELSATLIPIIRKHWRLACGALLLTVVAFAAGLLTASHASRSAAVVVPYPHELAQVSFAVAGDVIPHEPVRAAAAAAGDDRRRRLGRALQRRQRRLPSTPTSASSIWKPPSPQRTRTGSKPFMFDAPVALPQALKASGIKIVSFANNHVMDQGWAGFAETRDHLRESGLLFAGSGDTAQTAWQPVITEANGIKVGWLGMTRWLNGNRNPDKADQPHVNFFPYPGESGGATGADEATVLAAIKAARAQCDLLVVSVHWGIEYAPAPRPEDVDIAHKMLDAGASRHRRPPPPRAPARRDLHHRRTAATPSSSTPSATSSPTSRAPTSTASCPTRTATRATR